MVDDAWYILLGRSLAEGRGFRLVSSAVSPIFPIVPPGFPALLSIVFRVVPDFPSNVLWLKSISIAAMLAAGAFTGWYFMRWRGLPWVIALAIAVEMTLTPAFVFLATSTVMAECVYVLGQIVAIVALERSIAKDDAGSTVLAAVAIAATMMMRSMGIALLIAALLYLLHRRLWRRAALLAVVAGICLAPWSLYAQSRASTRAERMEHGGSIVYPYLESMSFRVASDPTSGQATARDIARRLGGNAVTFFGRDVAGVFVPELLRGPLESGQETISIGFVGDVAGSMGNAPATIAISFVLSALIVVGWIVSWRDRPTVLEVMMPLSVVMIVLVPYQTFRYTLTLAPFLCFYLMTGVGALFTKSAMRVVLGCFIGLAVLDHASYIVSKISAPADAPTIEWLADSQEVDQVLAWVNQHLDEGAVATSNAGLVNLRTGRKTVALDDAEHHWRDWKARGIRYLVSLRPLDKPSASRVGYRLLFETSRHKLWILEI